MREYYNEDCMQGMKRYPDNFFDLAIVDPPYGIGVGTMGYTQGVERVGKALADRKDYRHSEWDIRPTKEYFDELRRVSKKQIIWGATTLQIACHHRNLSSFGTREQWTP